MADTGNTATVAFGTTTGFTPNYYVVNGLPQTRGALEDSHLGTTNQKTYIPDDLINNDPFDCELEWDQSFAVYPPISAVAETITISYPLKSGEAVRATLAGSGFLTNFTGPVIQNGLIMRASVSIQFDGKTEVSYTAGTT